MNRSQRRPSVSGSSSRCIHAARPDDDVIPVAVCAVWDVAQAEQAFAEVLKDELDWKETVYLVSVELPDPSAPAPLSLS